MNWETGWRCLCQSSYSWLHVCKLLVNIVVWPRLIKCNWRILSLQVWPWRNLVLKTNFFYRGRGIKNLSVHTTSIKTVVWWYCYILITLDDRLIYHQPTWRSTFSKKNSSLSLKVGSKGPCLGLTWEKVGQGFLEFLIPKALFLPENSWRLTLNAGQHKSSNNH